LPGAAGQINYSTSISVYDIRFKETTVTTEHLAEGIAVDYDAEGRLAGIEILDAARRLGDPAVFKRVTLEDLAISHQPAPGR
jgi:YD repeat-containing protein